MSGSGSLFAFLTPLDLYYISVSSNLFCYGFLTIMCVGFVGNIFQILIFSRKTMRTVSTGVFFLALSISDTVYLLLCFYVVLIYGYGIPDRSNITVACRVRYFFNYFVTNFSAWMLAIISCDRWIRTQFPLKAQRICTPRTAIIVIIVVSILDISLHAHLWTPMFGAIPMGTFGSCGANALYPNYVSFLNQVWPVITIITVTLLPATLMIFFLVGIIIRVQTSRNRVMPLIQENSVNMHEKRRSNFFHRQMFILMVMPLILFFITTLPVGLFRFSVATLNVQQPFSVSLLISAILGVITASNYALNFYLHCLTSTLYRKEFTRIFPCSLSITVDRGKNIMLEGTGTQRQYNCAQQGRITQLIGRQSNTIGTETQGGK